MALAFTRKEQHIPGEWFRTGTMDLTIVPKGTKRWLNLGPGRGPIPFL